MSNCGFGVNSTTLAQRRIAQSFWLLFEDCLQDAVSSSVIVCGEGVDCAEPALVRQEDGKESSGAWFFGAGADSQGAAVFLDEFAGDPKAEAGAGIFLRGEEGFEDVVEVL